MQEQDYYQIKEAQNINKYHLERMTSIIVNHVLATLSEDYELVEKTITPDGEAITKVYTLEPYGSHKRMR